jgi:hypothetical protein
MHVHLSTCPARLVACSIVTNLDDSPPQGAAPDRYGHPWLQGGSRSSAAGWDAPGRVAVAARGACFGFGRMGWNSGQGLGEVTESRPRVVSLADHGRRGGLVGRQRDASGLHARRPHAAFYGLRRAAHRAAPHCYAVRYKTAGLHVPRIKNNLELYDKLTIITWSDLHLYVVLGLGALEADGCVGPNGYLRFEGVRQRRSDRHVVLWGHGSGYFECPWRMCMR